MSPLTRAKVCCRLLVLVSFLVLLLGLEGQCRAQTLPVSFVARIDTPLPGSPLRPPPGCIAAADFNSDSKLDIVSCGNANNIWVLQGNGDGTFQPAVTYTVGTNYPEAVVLADFNGDGKTDILVVNNDSTVSVLLNNGDGTFQTQVVTNITTNAPGVVASGDFNGDGKADIAVPVVVPQHGDSAVAILLGNGDGTFQSPIQSTGYAVTPSSIQVADFNGDGELDVSWEAIESVAVFLGNGNGTVQPPLNTDTKVEGFYLTVADFNNDGIPDLAISSYESIDVFLGKGDGTFGTELSAPVGLPYRALLVGDFNGDGIPDLACYSGGVEEISILLGKGDGTFQQPLTYNIPGDTIAAGDFNGDGRLDVAAPGIYGENGPLEVMSVALGKGDGSFQLDTIIGTGGHGSGVANGSLLIADLNGDGKPDLINDGGDYVAIFLGNGNGTFQKQIAFGLEGGGNQVTQSNAAAGDFNHDGKLDLAVVDTGYIGVFLGNGDGTLQPEVQYGNGNTDYVAVGDFNRDGNPDIVSADSTGTVSVLLGNGDGTFGFPESFPGVGSFIVVADFNHDGKLDVAGTGALILGNGDGTFGSPINYPQGAGELT